MLNSARLIGLLLAGAALSFSSAVAADLPREQVEFFEQKIRPLLVDKCYSCHSVKAEKVKGALLLDSKAAALKGGTNGPAVVPGDLEKSLLIKGVRYKDEKLQMPPDEQLSEKQVADLETWVKMGAPDPRTEVTSLTPDPNKLRKFWSFLPPKLPAIPTLKHDEPGLTPIDKLVRAKLESKGIPPSPPADKRTLLRRATFDLTGLPPSKDELDAFLADASPNAYEKVVDRLLASPHYGERWGRYWLDVARYADTKGYVFEEERRYPYSYVYRDWVIHALNDDVPYDQFLIKQLAADKLPPSPENRDLAAMGFLLLGRRFLNNQADIIDDRMDVLIRGTQGLTIGCARCHDHKFDPIPQQDYYSLYGIFAASQEPKELPIVGTAEKSPMAMQYEKEVKLKEEELEKVRHDLHAKKLAQLRSEKSLSDYLLATAELKDMPEDKLGKELQKRDLNHPVFNRWRAYFRDAAKSPQNPVWGPWLVLSALKAGDFAAKAPEECAKFSLNSDAKINPLVAKMFKDKKPGSLKEVAALYGAVLVQYAKPEKASDSNIEALRQFTYGEKVPPNVPFEELAQLLNREDHNKERDVRKKIDALAVSHPGAPPRAMVLNDVATPGMQHVFLRGDPNRPGPEAPRRFLDILAGPQRQNFKNGSGRLELAQAIASKDNPLTARVMANRVWLHHFGSPEVRTPSDFGVRSDPPANIELLDYLAVRLMENNWSLKKLHREIMLSKTYQQSSDDNPEARKLDPENALTWRFNRQRLDFEAMRDALLATSGQLDPTMGGRSVDLSAVPAAKRRSVYGYIDRQNLPGMFRAFDFASPDTHSPQRFNTTVPQQALYMMNSPFAIEQARALAVKTETLKTAKERIDALYRIVLERAPSETEIALGEAFIKRASEESFEAPGARQPPWQYGYGTFNEQTHHVDGFTVLPHFTGNSWQGGTALPDAKLGYVLLTKDGGHPGNPQHAVIRRWIAPRDGSVSVTGKLKHDNKPGDGVRARIVSATEGEKGKWTAHASATDTSVDKVTLKKGEALDFVVDCQADENSDGFTWKVTIKTLDYNASFTEEEGGIEWNSASGFSGPPGKTVKALAPWEKYAQVLLLSNEFVFID